MQIARILALIAFVAIALGQITAPTSTVNAGSSAKFSLSGSSVVDTVLLNLLGANAAGSGASVSISSSAQATISFGISISGSASAWANANVAGGSGSAATTSLASGLALSVPAISVTLGTGGVNTQITLTITTPKISASGSATVSVQLFAGFNDASASGTTYGAVAYQINAGGTTTYTIPAGFNQQLFLVAVDSSQAASAASAANSGQQSGSASIGGSSNFNFGGKFIPVAYNSNYSLAVGQQYSFGNNIYVTPVSSAASGSAAGNLQVQYVGNLLNSSSSGSGSASVAPNTAAYFKGYYQITGSGSTNVIQWTSDNTNSAFVQANGNAQITAQQFVSAYANTATWVKSNTQAGASASASSWSTVSSQRQVVNGKLSVYADVSTYSQWTVASGSSDATAIKAGLFVVVCAILAIVF